VPPNGLTIESGDDLPDDLWGCVRFVVGRGVGFPRDVRGNRLTIAGASRRSGELDNVRGNAAEKALAPTATRV